MTDSVSIDGMTWDKSRNELIIERSDLGFTQHAFYFGCELLVVGRRETRRYQMQKTELEPNTAHELSEIQGWRFIPVGGHGRRQPGPELVILND